MSVDYGARNTTMAEGLLDNDQVVGFFVQRGGKCVAQGMDGKGLVDTGLDQPLFK